MMGSRLMSAGALALLAVMPPAQSGAAAALRAAADYVAKEKVKGRVEIDPRELVSVAAGQSSDSDKLHSGATLSLLAIPGVSSVASMERARMCSLDPSMNACKAGGSAVFLSLSAPVINGKVATVEVVVSASRTVTASDSAQVKAVKAPAERDALLRRLNRPTSTRYRIELSRETTAWIVTKVLLIGAS